MDRLLTFQAPVLFKKCVDDAVKLYSAGSTEDTPLIAEWDDVEPAFKKALAALRIAAQTPDDIPSMSDEEKLHFMKMFQSFDRLFAQLNPLLIIMMICWMSMELQRSNISITQDIIKM